MTGERTSREAEMHLCLMTGPAALPAAFLRLMEGEKGPDAATHADMTFHYACDLTGLGERTALKFLRALAGVQHRSDCPAGHDPLSPEGPCTCELEKRLTEPAR